MNSFSAASYSLGLIGLAFGFAGSGLDRVELDREGSPIEDVEARVGATGWLATWPTFGGDVVSFEFLAGNERLRTCIMGDETPIVADLLSCGPAEGATQDP